MIFAFITGEVIENKFCAYTFFDWNATTTKRLGNLQLPLRIRCVYDTCMFPLSAVHLYLSRNLLGVHASYKNLLIYQRNSWCKRKDSPLIVLVFERQSEPSSLICKRSYCLHLALVVYYFCSYHHHHYCAI